MTRTKASEAGVTSSSSESSMTSSASDAASGWWQRNVLRVFVANFSLLQLFQMAFVVYYIAVVRTIERRYGLTSTRTGVIMAVNDVIHISVVIFIGYLGRKGHKPIYIAVTSIFLPIASLLYASPYFLFGAESDRLRALAESNNMTSSHEHLFCSSVNASVGDDGSVGVGEESRGDISNQVFYILCFASALNGLGGSALNILGMAYVDENAEKHNSALYLGIISSTFALGPILGIILGAICLRLPENLTGEHRRCYKSRTNLYFDF